MMTAMPNNQSIGIKSKCISKHIISRHDLVVQVAAKHYDDLRKHPERMEDALKAAAARAYATWAEYAPQTI